MKLETTAIVREGIAFGAVVRAVMEQDENDAAGYFQESVNRAEEDEAAELARRMLRAVPDHVRDAAERVAGASSHCPASIRATVLDLDVLIAAHASLSETCSGRVSRAALAALAEARSTIDPVVALTAASDISDALSKLQRSDWLTTRFTVLAHAVQCAGDIARSHESGDVLVSKFRAARRRAASNALGRKVLGRAIWERTNRAGEQPRLSGGLLLEGHPVRLISLADGFDLDLDLVCA